MKIKIRTVAMLLAHIGVVLAILYLLFAVVCCARANQIEKALEDPETAASVTAQERHLEKAVHEKDFSVLSIGQALSDKDDPARDHALVIVDLIIPLLCLVSGILLQIASARRKRKSDRSQRIADHINHSYPRRQS